MLPLVAAVASAESHSAGSARAAEDSSLVACSAADSGIQVIFPAGHGEANNIGASCIRTPLEVRMFLLFSLARDLFSYK